MIDLTKFAADMDFGPLNDEEQKWCYVIKNMWRLKDSDIPAEETVFRELYENCKISKLNTMEKQEYEKRVEKALFPHPLSSRYQTLILCPSRSAR